MKLVKQIPVITDVEDKGPPPVYWYNHILYLNSGFAVCHRPQDLGEDFVIVDTKPDRKSCPHCLPLVVAHNAKENAS